ncbi:MAG: hypothetical protein HRT53_17150 [Colwellia sp.]|nr:hypothetical protein [Colwellia sp.]
MQNKYSLGIEVDPDADIVFTSVNSKGGYGQLTKYVLEHSNIKKLAPSPIDIVNGFHIVKDKHRTIVFIVSVDSQVDAKQLLQNNLSKAFKALGDSLSKRTLWLPLMGTGAGGLSLKSSAEITKNVLNSYNNIEFGATHISVNRDIPKDEFINLQEIFIGHLKPSPPLPDDISVLVNEFLKIFPLKELHQLTIDEYSNTDAKNYFTYMLEHKTVKVGGIRGGSSFKFGIFKRKSTEPKTSSRTYMYSDGYAWLAQYGTSKEVAFNTIKNLIIKTARLASIGQVDDIVNISLDSRVKWKIAYLYQNFTYPSIISIYKKEALEYLTNLKPAEFTFARAYKQLIDEKPENIDISTYSQTQWRKWKLYCNVANFETDNKTGIQTQNSLPKENSDTATVDEYTYEYEEEENEPLKTSEEETKDNYEVEVKEVTAYSNDDINTEDQFNLNKEIKALAGIIAYKQTVPPLAIGIFGEWGGGKSFYMNKLKSEINQLSIGDLSQKTLQHEYPFYKNIVQIDFNAWNYVESDLWASLAQNIYQALYEHQNNGSEFNEYWLNVIKYGEKKSRALEQNLEGIRENLKNKTAEISNLEANLSTFYKGFEISDVSKIIRENFNDDIPTPISSILGQLESTEEAFHGLAKANGEISKISWLSLLTSSLKTFTKPITNRYIALSVLLSLTLIIIAYANPLGLEDLTKNITVTLGPFVAAIFTFGKAHLQKVTGWYKQFKSVKASLNALIKKNNQNFENETDKFKELNENLNKAVTDKLNIESEINQAKKRLGFLTPEMLINDHISNTIDDNRYGKHLGLPALLNEDFNELASAINLQNEVLDNNALFAKIEDEIEAYKKHPHINRIVLYIDDLDRCPPKVVIKVLEAINLFMASNLFIVVLGVDPRWLFSSIREHYSELMTHEHSKDDDCLDISTPEEYLEKIFQIPIWLQRPDSSEVLNLVKSIIGDVITQQSQDAPETDKQETSEHTTPQEEDITGESSTAKTVDEKDNQDGPSSQELKALETVQLQRLESIEIEYIQKLAPILGRSPRSIKRYLNLYRIIKTSLPDDKVQLMINPVNSETYGYKTIGFLLAVVVGWPRISNFIFKIIEEEYQDGETFTIASLLALLQSKMKLLNEQQQPEQDDRYLTAMRHKKAQKTLFNRLETSINEIDADILNETLNPLKNWNKEVARFSYNKLHDF